jgi:hypothetical protein
MKPRGDSTFGVFCIAAGGGRNTNQIGAVGLTRLQEILPLVVMVGPMGSLVKRRAADLMPMVLQGA